MILVKDGDKRVLNNEEDIKLFKDNGWVEVKEEIKIDKNKDKDKK